jgi:hypothetical protein
MCLLENLVKGMYQYGNSYYVVPLEMPFFYWENISESPIALTLYYHEILFKGLEKPSAVQQRGIVSLGMGLDVIQQSLSGTTLTICFGVLQRLDYGSAECQALVLVPTRDIAQETEKVIQSLGQCLALKLMFALEDIVPIQSSRFCQVEFRSSLAPLVVFLMCCKGEHYVQTTLQCLFWMKQMNYSKDVPRDRSVFYLPTCSLWSLQ